ncbi:MAG: peptidoglycan-binding protein [Candidatus Competibacteraceae bacterium]|nr:peptidoglycan-binding protein [Candidatus Competibacteraceae bacterium]
MGDFQRCIKPILEEEGGFADTQGDPGGKTKYGISQRAYPKLHIAELTREDAQAIYRRDYWIPIHGDELPYGLDLLMLDGAINQGVTTAVTLLQRALRIKDDGIIGPETLTAAKLSMPDILDAFSAERALRYEVNPNELRFGRGWYRRLFRMNRAAWQRATETTA